MSTKFCRDCKWSFGKGRFMECRAPQNMLAPFDPDVGVLRYSYCSTHRTDGLIGALLATTCGKSARWFQPREPEAVAAAAE